MKGQETAPINEHNLAALLGLVEMPLHIILGKPKKDSKAVKTKTFKNRVQKKK